MPNLTPRSRTFKTASLELAPRLEIRIAPLVTVDRDEVTHLDVRLFRRVASELGADAVMTAGGFKVPLAQVAEFAGKLLEVARAVAPDTEPPSA